MVALAHFGGIFHGRRGTAGSKIHRWWRLQVSKDAQQLFQVVEHSKDRVMLTLSYHEVAHGSDRVGRSWACEVPRDGRATSDKEVVALVCGSEWQGSSSYPCMWPTKDISREY